MSYGSNSHCISQATAIIWPWPWINLGATQNKAFTVYWKLINPHLIIWCSPEPNKLVFESCSVQGPRKRKGAANASFPAKSGCKNMYFLILLRDISMQIWVFTYHCVFQIIMQKYTQFQNLNWKVWVSFDRTVWQSIENSGKLEPKLGYRNQSQLMVSLGKERLVQPTWSHWIMDKWKFLFKGMLFTRETPASPSDE